MKAILPIRGKDAHGSGQYGAPRRNSRGVYSHRGIDFACYPCTEIVSNVAGVVSKLGYTYADDLSFRYVEITDQLGFRHRYFYVEPCVEVGRVVKVEEAIGTSQKLGDRYSGITEHVHYEVKDASGKTTDPRGYL